MVEGQGFEPCNDVVAVGSVEAMLSSLVKDLRDGIDTMIGERGMRLSGG